MLNTANSKVLGLSVGWYKLGKADTRFVWVLRGFQMARYPARLYSYIQHDQAEVFGRLTLWV